MTAKTTIEEHYQKLHDEGYPQSKYYTRRTAIYNHYRRSGIRSDIWKRFTKEAKEYIRAKGIDNGAASNLPTNKDISWEEMLDQIENQQSLYRTTVPITYEREIVLKNVTRPIIVSCSSDWHLCSVSTDHKEWRKHIKSIESAEDTYLICAGDFGDNMHSFKIKRAAMDQLVNKPLQDVFLAKVFISLCNNNKLLCVLPGNHEGFDERILGESSLVQILRMANRFLKDKEIPIMEGQAKLSIKINDQVYKFRVLHKTHFNSVYNMLHGAKQHGRFYFNEDFDVIVTAHQHVPGFEQWWYKGFYRYVIKTGTFKLDDVHSMRGWQMGVLGTPCLVLDQTRHDLTYFDTLSKAIAYRDSITTIKKEQQYGKKGQEN